MTSLLGWLDDPAADAGIACYGDDGWEHSSYQDIARAALQVAGCLGEAGVRPRDVVPVVLPSGPAFIAGFFGVLAAGATPSPLVPPTLFADSAAYGDHLTGLLRTAQPRAVLTSAGNASLISQVRGSVGRDFPVLTEDEVTAAAPLAARRQPPPAALVQFSSGSTGSPRAVQVSMSSLESNLSAIAGWLGMRPGDVTATWLPVHHDMGLIGCLLTPAATGTGVLMLTPHNFIRSPLLWLDCFGKLGATLSATPAFGLARVVRQLEREPPGPGGWDLSRWRTLIIGAERIDADLLRRFASALQPWGFWPDALCPAYGLAESTLAVTGVRQADPVRWVSLPPGQDTAAEPRRLPHETASPVSYPVVGCGMPLGRAEVRVAGPDGRTVPDGELGEILVRGPSVAAAYLGPGRQEPITDEDGWLHTGDAGLLHGSELFVVGRTGDAIKVRGRSVFAEDIEAQVALATGISRHLIAALLGTAGGADTAVVLIERAGAVDWDRVSGVLRRHLGAGVAQRLVTGPAGCIARTSSGKPRRRLMWQRLTAAQLPAEMTEHKATRNMNAGPVPGLAGTRS